MHIMKFWLISAMIFCIFFSGCSSSDSQYLVCNEVSYITEFPETYALENPEIVQNDLAGCVDFFTADTLAVCKMWNTPYLWRVLSLNDGKILGDFFKKGEGPGELLSLPSSEDSFVEDSQIFCNIYINAKNSLNRVNLTESVDSGRIIMDEVKDLTDYGTAFPIYQLFADDYFMVTRTPFGASRSVLKGDSVHTTSCMDELNQAVAQEDINTLSAVRCINKERGLVAEAMLRLNQINVYSVDRDEGYTLCIGKELHQVEETDLIPRMNRHEYFSGIISQKEGFAALYRNNSGLDFLSDKGNSEILFFSWDGKPLKCLKVPYMVRSFSIYKGYLYTLALIGEDETLMRYRL